MALCFLCQLDFYFSMNINRFLHGSDLGPLNICYRCVVWASCGTPLTVGVSVVFVFLGFFCLFLGPFSSYGLPHPALI